MTNNEIGSYQRNPFSSKQEGIIKRLKRIDIHELTEYGILLLLSRAALLNSINPFMIAFFAATFPKQKKVYGIVVACISVLLSGFGVMSLKYLGAIAIITAFSLLLGEELSQRSWLYALIATLAIAANGMIYVFFDGFLLYDILTLTLESAAIFLSYFAFCRAAAILRTITKRRIFENEETLSLVLLAAAIILSISSFPYGTAVSHTLAVLLVMILSLTGGAAVSAMAGTLLGLIMSTADVLPAQVIGVYAVCAMVSGLLRNYGKWGVCAGFLMTNAAVMIYFNSSLVTFITYYYILAASVILFFLPMRFLSLFGAVARTPGIHPAEDPVTRTKEILNGRLEDAANSFGELSGIFKEIIDNKMDAEVRDAGLIFEKTAEKVCKNCSMSRYCHQKKFHDTMTMLENIFTLMQERGYAADIDFPESFRTDCLHFENFLHVLNKNYDIYKVNLMWSGKVLESRTLVAEQFRNIASILENIRSRLKSDISNDMRLENKIAAALDRKGIVADCICVTSADGYEVTMTAASCGGERLCSTTAAAAISSALGVPMLSSGRNCGNPFCKLRFREQERFCTDVGLARIAQDRTEKSGDNYTFQLLGDGKYVLALSDGMGSGTRASVQSSITIELIKRLLSAGFDKETSLRLINSVLLAGTEDESFATADMCLVNLYTGALEFIKIGAAPSYIKSGNEIQRIMSTSLPAGIVEHTEPDCELHYAKNGDFVILATDGITDVLENSEENIVNKILMDYKGISAQTLADQILLESIRLSGGNAYDDMTVLCARISEVM